MGKKILLVILATVAIIAGLAVAEKKWLTGVAPVGGGGELSDAPDITLKDLQGSDVSLAQLRGKVVVVNFWATWCGPCRIEMPWFIEFHEKYGPQGLAILGVAMDEEGRQVVAPFIEKEEFEVDGRKAKVNYTIVLGSDAVAQQFGGLIGLPTTLVISREGKITKRFIGLVNHELIQKEIEAQLQ
jgi:cytochrome c biogenesis protein CcmG/thiol:disulfide interchange protein DsbE